MVRDILKGRGQAFNEYLEPLFSRSAAVSAAPLDSAEPVTAK
jgi:hypothetical protein